MSLAYRSSESAFQHTSSLMVCILTIDGLYIPGIYTDTKVYILAIDGLYTTIYTDTKVYILGIDGV